MRCKPLFHFPRGELKPHYFKRRGVWLCYQWIYGSGFHIWASYEANPLA